MELKSSMSLLQTLLPIWLLLLYCTIIPMIFNAGTVAVCIATGVRFKKIGLFYGKPVLNFQTRFGSVCIGYIPTGGFVELDMDAFPKEPASSRCAVTLSGPVALFLSALVCLGFQHAGFSFAATFPQLIELLASPISKGKEFFGLLSAKAIATPITAYGVLAMKAAALNLLPLPTLAGGRLLVEMSKKREASAVAKAINYLGSVTAFCILVWFVILLVRHFSHGQGKA